MLILFYFFEKFYLVAKITLKEIQKTKFVMQKLKEVVIIFKLETNCKSNA